MIPRKDSVDGAEPSVRKVRAGPQRAEKLRGVARPELVWTRWVSSRPPFLGRRGAGSLQGTGRAEAEASGVVGTRGGEEMGNNSPGYLGHG